MNITIGEYVSICPHCNRGIRPNVIRNFKYDDKCTYNQTKWFAILQCPVCKNHFFADYLVFNDYYENANQIIYCEIYPKSFNIEINFDDRLKDSISPDFYKIYQQALIADQNNLTEITGIAFRKAFEALVKDYAAYLNKTVDKQEIYKLTLKQTIDKYFKSSEFEIIFRKISWLGNDYSHTFNKHDNYNVNDLKRFIHACISKIISQLDLEELSNIESKNN